MKTQIILFINFINENSGCLLVLLTFVYVIGTLLILVEMRKSRLSLLRPFINIYFFRKDELLFLTIENIGNVACKALNISFEPNLAIFGSDNKIVHFLPATGRIGFLIGKTESFFLEQPLNYSVNIAFLGVASNKRYKETFTLDVKEMNEIVQI